MVSIMVCFTRSVCTGVYKPGSPRFMLHRNCQMLLIFSSFQILFLLLFVATDCKNGDLLAGLLLLPTRLKFQEAEH